MTLLASHPAAWTICVFALLATAALMAAEWRRPDRRRRPARLGATLLAVMALALWALRPAWRGNGPETPAGETAVLWTGDTASLPAPPEVEARYRFALPGARVPANCGALFLPDAATLRRRFPEIGRLRILGDGLEPAELPALAGLRVEFTPGPGAAADAPSIRSLRCPRVLPLGETLVAEGRVGGLPPGKTIMLTLEAPDGTATEATTAPADANGEAAFALRAASPTAAGKSVWRLRPGGEALGVEVRAPALPRVLVLESTPRFDDAPLRHWYGEAGGNLRARVRVGQDRYRFFAADGSAPLEFGALDAALLAGFDLVLADGRALASLPAPEREILRAAVADTGLGVLVLADDAILPPANVASDRAWIFPWQWRALEAVIDGGTEHLARVRWPGLAQPADVPLPTAPFEIVPASGQSAVVHDAQGRVLAALAACGRGTLGLTLVRETGRWQRANAPEAFAGYWSSLFTRTARRLETSGRWTLVDGDNGPVFVDRPLEFTWSGAPPKTVRVADEADAAPLALPPQSDPAEPARWRVVCWPRRAGWHRLESDGGTLEFYVHPAGSWPALAAARKREATERFAAQSAAGPVASVPPHPPEPTPIPAGWWFAAFLLGAGFLWVERRLAVG